MPALCVLLASLIAQAFRTIRRGARAFASLFAILALSCAPLAPTHEPPRAGTVFYHADHLGGVALQTDAQGAVLATRSYDPYGAELVHASEPYGYTGKEYEPDTGLYDFAARAYDPVIGRFISPDPLAVESPSFAESRPRELNPYAYAAGDPVNLVDPSGLAVPYIDPSVMTATFRGVYNTLAHWYYNVAAGFYGAAAENVTAPVQAVLHPAETAKAVCTAMTHPAQTSRAIYGAGADFVSRVSQGDPRAVGQALFAGVSAAAGVAAKAGVVANAASVKYIGRLDDLKGIPRHQTLLDDLPDLGSPRANYYQNSSVLRRALSDGYEIRDASSFRLNSELASTLLRPDRTIGQTFLGAERLILDNKGLQLGPSGIYVSK